MTDRPSTPVDAAAPPSPLELVANLTAEIAVLEHRRRCAIFLAAQGGASWTQICRALGTTAQAAHKRYRWLHYNAVTDQTWHEPPLA